MANIEIKFPESSASWGVTTHYVVYGKKKLNLVQRIIWKIMNWSDVELILSGTNKDIEMNILRIAKCKYCGRRATLMERSGGWTVDCHYSNPITAMLDNQEWCDKWEDYPYSSPEYFSETPNDAIHKWNKENEVSDESVQI